MPNRRTPTSATTTWTTAGVIALPLSAVLLALGTFTPQPDQASDPDGWAHFVTSTSYLASHIAANLVGAALVLGLRPHRADRRPDATTRAHRNVLAVTGKVFFASPRWSRPSHPRHRPGLPARQPGSHDPGVPRRHDRDHHAGAAADRRRQHHPRIAAARSGVVPRWAGIIWATATVIFYLLGFALGVATTGASLPTQPVGAALLALSGTAMAWPPHTEPDRIDRPRPRAAVTVPSRR